MYNIQRLKTNRDQGFLNFLFDPLLETMFNLHSAQINQLNIKSQSITNLPVFNTI